MAAGNEGAAQHHYTAELDYVKNQDTVELRIADKEEGFSMEFGEIRRMTMGYRYSHRQEKSCM